MRMIRSHNSFAYYGFIMPTETSAGCHAFALVSHSAWLSKEVALPKIMACFENTRRVLASFIFLVLCLSTPVLAQSAESGPLPAAPDKAPKAAARGSSSTLARYFDPVQGASSNDLVRRALTSNGELAAARLDTERARARLRQAGLRLNPVVDLEYTTEKLTGTGNDRFNAFGFAMPIELGGKRARRLELAEAELEAAEAEVADRERRLTGEALAAYAEALAALRELEITERLNELNVQTVSVVKTRVDEGETPALELSLLEVEVDRLGSRRSLVEGRLQAALVRLKSRAGIPPDETLRLREDLAAPVLPAPPASLEAAVEIALRTRPDLRLARLNEEVAAVGLKLAKAQAVPDATLFTRYTFDRTIAGLPTPLVAIPNYSRRLTFGVSIGLPIFNKNQGAKAEAATAITQAQRRREFAEAIVRADVTSAYTRYHAAQAALATFERGVIDRSNRNIEIIRTAYQIGAYRVTDLLAEQRRLVDSQRDFTEALTERYRALADLQLAIGAPIDSK